MINYIIFVAVIGSIPIILRFPFAGIIFWYWISIMNPHRLAWGFAYDLPVAMIVGATTLGAFLISRERKALPSDGTTVLLILLTIWVTFTTLIAANPEPAWEKWDRTIKILLMTFVTLALVTNWVRLHAVIWVMVLSLGFYMLKGGLFTLIGGADNRVWGPPQSFIADNNQFAMALLMAAPFVRYLQVVSASRAVRIGCAAALATCVLAVIGTYSRGAFLAMLACGFVLAMRTHYKMQLLALMAAVTVVAFAITPEEWIARIESIGNYEEDVSALGRFDAWTFAWRYVLDHPLTGGGFLVNIDPELFYRYVPDAITVRAMHSIYFEVLGEHGFVGLILFLALMASAWRGFGRVRRLAGDDALHARELAGLGQVSLVAYAVAGLFYNLAFFDLFYLLVAVQICLCRIADAELVQNEVRPTGPAKRFSKSHRPVRTNLDVN